MSTAKCFHPLNFIWCGLTLTHEAAKRIHELEKTYPEISGIRLGIKRSGCAGFIYTLDTVIKPKKDDLIFETDGAKLYVPIQAMPFIDGTKVDYRREGLNSSFKFHNPRAQNKCGCGESFGI